MEPYLCYAIVCSIPGWIAEGSGIPHGSTSILSYLQFRRRIRISSTKSADNYVTRFLKLFICTRTSTNHSVHIRGGHRHLQIGWMLDIDLTSEAPPPPPPAYPDVCIQSVGICVARRGRKLFIASLGQDVTYLSLHPMPPPPLSKCGTS